MVKQLSRLLVAMGIIAMASPASAEPYELEAEGIVHEVRLSEGTVRITGFDYEVASNASVMVRGAVSSVAALAPDMKVRFTYEVHEGIDAEVAGLVDRKIIVELEQLPDSYLVEEF